MRLPLLYDSPPRRGESEPSPGGRLPTLRFSSCGQEHGFHYHQVHLICPQMVRCCMLGFRSCATPLGTSRRGTLYPRTFIGCRCRLSVTGFSNESTLYQVGNIRYPVSGCIRLPVSRRCLYACLFRLSKDSWALGRSLPTHNPGALGTSAYPAAGAGKESFACMYVHLVRDLMVDDVRCLAVFLVVLVYSYSMYVRVVM